MIPHIFETFDPSGLYAEIDTRNTASIKVVEKWGFIRTGLTKEAAYFKGATSDEYRYSLSRETWEHRSKTH